MKSINLPNKLTILRFFMVPVVIAVLFFIPDSTRSAPELWILRNCIAALIFLATSITDMIDGKIARNRNLITDFGKFMDPLADKCLVIGTMVMLLFLFDNIAPYFVWVLVIVIIRELAVTGLRLVIHDFGVVLAAGKLGKIKTVLQMVFVMTALLEPVLYRIFGVRASSDIWLNSLPPLTLLTMASVLLFTVWSGVEYFRGCSKYLDPSK